ncbi:hypothetical protein [Promineifilum sp.]|uniref:hypothetical protein n=1 Tax=Promineifilum sp. TaxID=2664178 RepID=UPI0035AF275E
MNHLLSVLAILLTLAACSGSPTPPIYFKVAVIVDMTTDPVTREQAEDVLAVANQKFIDLTGFGLQLHDFVEDHSGGSIASLVENHMEHTSDLPNGILVFSVGDEDRARIHRAYAQQIPAPKDFKNAFISPYLGDGYMYVAILQFNYRYAACGYAGTGIIQSHLSSPGECPGADGQACAGWHGMQVCPAALEFLEGHTPIDMAAGTIPHEFMHSFSDKGPDDHYSSEACRAAMGWEPSHYVFEEAEYYSDFCPFVYDVFGDSYRP